MKPKFEQLIEMVYEKTQDGSLEWKEAAADDAFEVELGTSTLLIFSGHTPQENLPYVTVTLFDALGRVVERETVPEDPDLGNGVVEELYKLARSKARDSEQTIDELLRELR